LRKEKRIIILISGKILRGEDAPLAAELENWLKENPGKKLRINL
jgi:hypothetical protein